MENRYLYNQGAGEKTFKTERIYDLGLNVDQSRDRVYDYITGRWWQVDPKADQGGQESWSTYHYSFNNPIRYNDPLGDCPECEIEEMTNVIAATVSDGLVGLYNLTVGYFTHQEASNDADGITIQIGERQDPKTVSEAFFKTTGDGLKALSVAPSGQALGALAKTGPAVTSTLGKAASDLAKAEARVAKLSKVQRPGQDMTKAGKDAVKDLSKAKNDGKTVCVTCKQETIPAVKDKKGVKPPGNRTEIDHRKRKREGGSGTPDNGDVNCRDCNQKKN